MKEILNLYRKQIITLGIIMGSIYLIYMVINRVSFAFGQELKQYGELLVLPFDFMLALPAFLGLFYFYRTNKTNNWLIPLSYLIYSFVILAGIATIFIGQSALGTGLVLIMIVGPIACIISIFQLITWLLERKK